MSIQFLYPYFYISYMCFLLLNSRSFLFILDINLLCFPGGSDGKASACNAGDLGLIPGPGRSPGEMAIHSSILAWKIPWMEEPGELQSMGSQRVGHS